MRIDGCDSVLGNSENQTVLRFDAELAAVRRAKDDALRVGRVGAAVQRHKLKLKARLESSLSKLSFKRSVPGGFHMGFIGSSCTAPPYRE